MAPPRTPDGPTGWAELVERVRQGDQAAVEDLYHFFSRGVRLLLCRELGAEHAGDRVHDIFLTVLEAIRNGSLHSPERLPGFIRTVVRRHIASAIHHASAQRHCRLDIEEQWGLAGPETTPEQQTLHRERVELIRSTLAGLSSRDREILTRFYLYEQSAEEICAGMGLNETQFRLLKSRAKARFGEQGRRRLQAGPLREIFLRKTAGSND